MTPTIKSVGGKSTAPARAYLDTPGRLSLPHRSRQVALPRARQTTTASSWEFPEQEGHLGLLPSSLPSSLIFSSGMGAIDLPLRASNEGLLRPRVARAQKIISLHPVPLVRGHPRIPSRSGSPRIDHDSPFSSEPLNFPQLSSTFSSSQHRHSSCSII